MLSDFIIRYFWMQLALKIADGEIDQLPFMPSESWKIYLYGWSRKLNFESDYFGNIIIRILMSKEIISFEFKILRI